jgi:hypothetical protein
MQRLEAEGGSTIKWHNKKISLICVETGEDADLFLFVSTAPLCLTLPRQRPRILQGSVG